MNGPDNPPDPRVEFFNKYAEVWDNHEHSGNALEVLSREAELLDLQPGQDVLEVGCGTGKVTAWLAEWVAPARVTAIDFAPEMIAHAQAKNIDADFAVADACADDLGQEMFDVIFCFHVFPHLRDPNIAMIAFARALRPGGRLIVMHAAGSEHINACHANIEGPVHADHLPVGDEWNDLLRPAGLAMDDLIDREDLFLLDAHKTGVST